MKKEKKPSRYSKGEENRLLMAHGYNPKVLYMGTLCGRNHDFEGTGFSVRNRKYGYCYACSRFLQEQHREERLEMQAEYRAKNQKKIKENARRYREENQERIAAYFREWYVANREKVRQRRNVSGGSGERVPRVDRLKRESRMNMQKKVKGRSDGKKITKKKANSKTVRKRGKSK